ncbi:MAG: hypothetical protein MI867_08010, partial [Pseudomonadales bacterium]|nr:hypothetical protein [Pseudomonadales bacterium]
VFFEYEIKVKNTFPPLIIGLFQSLSRKVYYRNGYFKNMDFNSVAWQASAAHLTAMKPRLTISPVISNGIATEYGVWDYSWGLSFNLASQLWPGGIISASVTDHFESSEDYETGFFRNAKLRSGLREMTIQQGFKLSSFGFNNTHFGRIIYDYIGLQNETLLFTPSGAHQVLLKLGDFEHEDTNEQRDYQLLTYRYYIDDYDISLRFTQGKFWGGDNGFRVNALFQFGDQTIDLFYKNTDAKDVFSNETSAEFIGIAWKLPLTFRKDWSSKYFQVKGHEAWRWGFETRIGEEVNSIAFGVAGIPTQEWEIERTYLNNDKLSPEYIYRNIQRLKEASTLEK